MNFDVVVTCAVTGAGDTTGRSPHVPVTPKEVAEAAIQAAKAGASAAHLHVRDPETGKGSRDPKLFKEAVDRVRDSGVDVIINLTAGMGGDWAPSDDNPAMPGPGTDMIGPEERLAHVKECMPEICSLDCVRSILATVMKSTFQPRLTCARWQGSLSLGASNQSWKSLIWAIFGLPTDGG